MNTPLKPRNRIRPTSAEARQAADQAAKQLDALGARLMTAYFFVLVAFIAGLGAGVWL